MLFAYIAKFINFHDELKFFAKFIRKNVAFDGTDEITLEILTLKIFLQKIYNKLSSISLTRKVKYRNF